jgi:lysyl-tRNA synthetase class II
MHITISKDGVEAFARLLDFAHEMSDFLDSNVTFKNGDELDVETFKTLHKSISFVPDTKEELRDEATFWRTRYTRRLNSTR